MKDDFLKGRINSFESMGAVDGPGLRFVVFLQGCPLRCAYCHNPETWSNDGGKEYSVEEVMNKALRYSPYFGESGGVTVSGGEPLLQWEFVSELFRGLKAEGIHTALDTAGAVTLSVSQPVLDASDLILLDIKAFDNDLCKQLTGRGNEDTLKTLGYCELSQKPVWLRHVLVPGLTLEKGLLEALADYLAHFSCIQQIELLPFHKMGEYKWKELRYPYVLSDTPEPTREELKMAREVFESRNLKVLLKD
jgi:pyruvate formate lyase activating enzyme